MNGYPMMMRIKTLAILVPILMLGQENLNMSRHNAITRAIERVSPAVASINITQLRNIRSSPFFQDPFFEHFFPENRFQKKVKGSGSGVVISPDGYVMTNFHVIENASEVIVTLPGGEEYEAEIIGTDRVTDLTLLKLNGESFPYAQLGDSDDLIIGEWVVALGNPFGLFNVNQQPTATAGIVSAVDMDFGQQSSGKVFQDMIQTDAAINPGNSGGPLVNSLGEVIGVNTFIFTGSNISEGSIGIGFAIPINRVKRIAEELKNTGRVDRSFATGLTVQSLTRNVSVYLDIPFDSGVMIVEVEDGSTADKSGLKAGDIIVKVNGQKVNRSSDIRKIIEEGDLRSGDKLNMRIYREGRYRTKSLKLGKV